MGSGECVTAGPEAMTRANLNFGEYLGHTLIQNAVNSWNSWNDLEYIGVKVSGEKFGKYIIFKIVFPLLIETKR